LLLSLSFLPQSGLAASGGFGSVRSAFGEAFSARLGVFVLA